ncbi:MAG TPA: ABC transporter permease [Acidobacteriaceae bacterium]|nr:ABC transporter permease [Acidobacteriaceae bacterium]
MRIWSRFLRPERAKADLDAEIESHLALAAAAKQDCGTPADEARRAAEREFGNQALVKDVVRRMWGWVWLESLQRDVVYALRQLRRSRGFSITVIATLAFGISAATGMFTVVDHVLLRPLPFPHPERLVIIREASLHGPRDITGHGAIYLDLQAWRERNSTFEQIAYYSENGPGGGRFNFLEGKGGSVSVRLAAVSPNFFSTLSVLPGLGHGFEPNPDPQSDGKNTNTLVLSDSAWRQIYGNDPEILGKKVLLNGKSYAVVGVMPRGFTFGDRSDRPEVWTALQLDDADKIRNGPAREYEVVGRLKPGVKAATAEADLKTLQTQLAKEYTDPDTRERNATVTLRKYLDWITNADLKNALLALLAAAGVLWLIACVNVTNLFLVRAAGRQREIAVRGALGASRARIIQQLIAEALVLSSASSLLGTLLAFAAIKLFEKQIPAHLPIYISGSTNGTILLFLVALTLLSTMFSSVWPSLLAVHRPIEPALRQGSQQSGRSRSQHRIGSSLIVAEIAMSLTLLAACGLLLRTIYALRHVPLGFRTDHIVVANLTIPTFRFANRNLTSELYLPLLERVQHLPGVQAATLMTEVPLGQTFNMRLTLQGKNFGGNRRQDGLISSNFRAVGPEAQRVFGLNMLAGRYFNEQDTAGSQPVAVVNRAFARLYAPDPQNLRSVLDMHLLNMRGNQPTIVVGVLDDARQSSITQSEPETEVSIPQVTPDTTSYLAIEGSAMDLAVRTDRPAATLTPEIRSLLRQASPELANAVFTTMDQIVAESYGSQTLAAHLLEFFGGTALLLCVSGLYSLLAYVVTQRTREIALRVAVGAQRGQVLWLILRQAGVLVVAGVLIGTIVAAASGRLVQGFLYGVADRDFLTLVIVALLLLVSGALASYLPARRAANVNPVDALRAE